MRIGHALRELHEQLRKLRIHTVHTTVLAIVHIRISATVLMRQLIHAAESQERTETHRNRCAALQQRVTNQHAWLKTYQQTLFRQNHTADTISRLRNHLAIKLADVLVTIRRKMILTILVQAKIKLSPMLNNRLIQRTQQYIVVIAQLRQRQHQLSMVFTCVTINQCRRVVHTGAVRTKHLLL